MKSIAQKKQDWRRRDSCVQKKKRKKRSEKLKKQDRWKVGPTKLLSSYSLVDIEWDKLKKVL